MSDVPAILTIMVSAAGGWALLNGGGRYETSQGNAPTHAEMPDSADRTIHLSQGPDGYFYADAKVNGAPIRFLVDTGANTTVMLRKDAELAGLPVLDPVSLRTAGHAIQASHSRIEKLEIGDSRIENLPAVIVEGGMHASLIGTNALAKLGPVSLDGNQLRLD